MSALTTAAEVESSLRGSTMEFPGALRCINYSNCAKKRRRPHFDICGHRTIASFDEPVT